MVPISISWLHAPLSERVRLHRVPRGVEDVRSHDHHIVPPLEAVPAFNVAPAAMPAGDNALEHPWAGRAHRVRIHRRRRHVLRRAAHDFEPERVMWHGDEHGVAHLAVGVLEEDGVLVHPGYFYDFPRASFLILSLLPPLAEFRDATARILFRVSG